MIWNDRVRISNTPYIPRRLSRPLKNCRPIAAEDQVMETWVWHFQFFRPIHDMTFALNLSLIQWCWRMAESASVKRPKNGHTSRQTNLVSIIPVEFESRVEDKFAVHSKKRAKSSKTHGFLAKLKSLIKRCAYKRRLYSTTVFVLEHLLVIGTMIAWTCIGILLHSETCG